MHTDSNGAYRSYVNAICVVCTLRTSYAYTTVKDFPLCVSQQLKNINGKVRDVPHPRKVKQCSTVLRNVLVMSFHGMSVYVTLSNTICVYH